MPQSHSSGFQATLPIWLLPIVSVLAPACGDGGDGQSDPSQKVYVSESYGYAVSFDEDTDEAVGFATVDGTCWAQPVPSEVWWAAPRDDATMDFDYLGQKNPGMPFSRVRNLDQACPEGVLETSADEGFVPDWEQEFELFQKTFQSQYAFFALRDVDWDEQVKSARKKLDTDMSVEDFFYVLSQAVAPLGDGHIVIQAGENLAFTASARPDIYASLSQEAQDKAPSDEEDLDGYVANYVSAELSKLEGAIENKLVTGSEHGKFTDPMFWARIEHEGQQYTYVRFTSFSEIVPSEDFPVVADNVAALHKFMDDALQSPSSQQGLVIDVRINDGGWDHLGRELVSRFVDQETHVYSKRVYSNQIWGEKTKLTVLPHDDEPYTRPVIVLTGPSTVSAAETFVMAMRELDQVRTVGDFTHGITSDATPKFLPSGIYFSLSSEEYTSPDGEVFERVGVRPDIELPVFSQEDRALGKDSALLRALEDLATRASR